MRLYAALQLPGYWIGEDESGALFVFPNRWGGWAARVAYRGPRKGFVEYPAESAAPCGWPPAKRAPGRPAAPHHKGPAK